MLKERKQREAGLEILSTDETVGGMGGSLLTPLSLTCFSNFAVCILHLCIHSLKECRKHVRHVPLGDGDSICIPHTEL